MPPRDMSDEFKQLMYECRVYDNLHWGLWIYLEYGIIPGDFLRACLENNLGCIGIAPHQRYNPNAVWMQVPKHSYAPSNAWGSAEKVQLYSKKIREKE